MYLAPTTKLAIYVQNEFGKGNSKTAEGILRYAPNPVVAVIDASNVGKSIQSLVGIDHGAPIVDSIDSALSHAPQALVIGTAWVGGKFPHAWRQDIIRALHAGLDIVNGLHDFLADDEEIAAVAKVNKCRLFDVRRPPTERIVGSGLSRNHPTMRILTVGTDSSIGKMTTALELCRQATKQGYSAKFIATGQTGMVIAGEGVCIDRVIGDFMAGAIETLIKQIPPTDHDFIFVEGQGSLAHPGFSGVTLSLMHGACPHGLILCHKPKSKYLDELPFLTPSLSQMIQASEMMADFLMPTKVLGIALNTSGLDEKQALAALESAHTETQLPCSDPIRFGVKNLFEAIVKVKEKNIEANPNKQN